MLPSLLGPCCALPLRHNIKNCHQTFFFFCLCHVARLARLLLRNQSFSSIKRHKKKKGKRCLWDEAVIKHSWSLEFWRTGISPCGVQLKPFHKLALHVLWTLIFFSARFHYLLRQARFAPLKIHTQKTRTRAHSQSSLSVPPATGTLVYSSISSASCSRGREGKKWQAMRNDSGSVCHTVAARSRGF